MVNQSELAFRILVRRHGVHLAYTPMVHAAHFHRSEKYRNAALADLQDRPVVQFCGNDPALVTAAALQVESRASAVDLNFGCPQNIARKGNYGAFLLDHPDLMFEMVASLRAALSPAFPVFAKIRLRECPHETRAIAEGLADAGASLVAVHGRTRAQNKQLSGRADWAAIRSVVEAD